MLPFQKRFLFSLLLCIPILCCGQVLFPGDTNNDGLCNYLDLLPVGLCYGLEGPPRPIPGTAWLPSNYILWPQNMPGTVLNHAFADADGNGFVDSLDLTAILLNYDLSQNQSVPEPMSYFPTDSLPNGMAIQVVYDKDTVMAGDTLHAEIWFDYPPSLPPDSGLVGIAFSLQYDTAFVEDPVLIQPDTTQGDLMFVTAQTSGISIYRSIVQPGELQISASGRGTLAFNHTRKVTGISFIIVQDIHSRTDTIYKPFELLFSESWGVKPDGRLVVPGTKSPEVTLFQISSIHESQPKMQFYCYPNPTGNTVHVFFDQIVSGDLEVYDLNGRVVKHVHLYHTSQHRFDLHTLPDGTYKLRFCAENAPSGKEVYESVTVLKY